MNVIKFLLLIGLLSGCTTPIKPESSSAEQSASIDAVVKLIKSDVKTYQDYAASVSNDEPRANACKGVINFEIQSIKIAMKVQTMNGVEGKAGVSLPVGISTFGPKLSASEQKTNTQLLTFTMYPEKGEVSEHSKGKIDYNKFPIAFTLSSLRENLLDASDAKPCMALSKGDDKGATFEFGFTLVSKGSAEAGFDFVIFSLGASKTGQQEIANTITVTFTATKSASGQVSRGVN